MIERGSIRFEDTLGKLLVHKPMMYPKGERFQYNHSEYNPNKGMISVLASNYGDNVWKEMRKIREEND